MESLNWRLTFGGQMVDKKRCKQFYTCTIFVAKLLYNSDNPSSLYLTGPTLVP